jgi:50S ribosome-binding GTPase
MTVVDIDAVRDWLQRLPGASPAGQHADDWDAFARRDRPVVTLFGSYDTGKSSLLRRLLVDAGSDVPSWLTISARHETFEVNEVEVGSCTVRDTPGFAVGASDIRAQNNSRRAIAAVGLTDIGVAVLTSQLATAERDMLQELFTRGWPAGTMWFVISRFDEAGADPEGDLEGYRLLSDRKVRELREMFALDDRAPVFVVAQDPFQTAGADTDLYPEIWDAFRDWDGIGDLADAVAGLARTELPAWRHAAGQRYWSAVLAETMTELRTQLTEYTARAEVAASGVARRENWEKELDHLDGAARAALDGLVEEVVRRYGDTTELPAELQRTLDEWFARHEGRLQRLRQSIRKTKERERARPSWAGFASLVATLESTQDASAPTGPGAIAGHLDKVGTMLIGTLKAASDPATSASGKKASVLKATEGWGRHLGTVEAALPMVVYAAQFIDDYRAGNARQNQERAAAETLRRSADECTRSILDNWQPFVDEIRAEIIAETADQVGLDMNLRRLVEQLREAIAVGERLLGTH